MASDFLSTIAEAEARLGDKAQEAILGKSLLQPGTNLNSGSRKLMFSVHLDHRLQLLNGEKAILETGYENKFGDYSSSVLKTDRNFNFVAKISKFSFSPNHHYYLIMEDPVNKVLDVPREYLITM